MLRGFFFSPRVTRGYNAGMKYSLRSLMFVVAVGPPLLAGGYFCLRAFDSLELRTLVAFGLASIVLVVCLKAALRGDV